MPESTGVGGLQREVLTVLDPGGVPIGRAAAPAIESGPLGSRQDEGQDQTDRHQREHDPDGGPEQVVLRGVVLSESSSMRPSCPKPDHRRSGTRNGP